jgi:hypothetical protein
VVPVAGRTAGCRRNSLAIVGNQLAGAFALPGATRWSAHRPSQYHTVTRHLPLTPLMSSTR